MVLFPTAKINLGLRVSGKRKDDFHNIESVFYPIPMSDVIEFCEAQEFKLEIFGKTVPGKLSENILFTTWKLLHDYYNIPPLAVILLKNIPAGSGLGGGSADAAFFLKGMNDFFGLMITPEKLAEFALQLGSDCPFFLYNAPAFVSGRGEVIQPVEHVLNGLWLVLVIPEIHVSTAEMFSRVHPEIAEMPLTEIMKLPVGSWPGLLSNDFEKVVFTVYPRLVKIKQALMGKGALFASMTGTGSALYGIFERKPETAGLEKLGNVFSYQLD